jgi:hypothetical protein
VGHGSAAALLDGQARLSSASVSGWVRAALGDSIRRHPSEYTKRTARRNEIGSL